MNTRALVTLVAGIVLSGAAVLLVARELNHRPGVPTAAKAAPLPVDQVVVASADIAFGTEVTKAQLTLASWPKGTQPPGSFARIEDVVSNTGEPRVALRPIVRGEPILQAKVSGFGGKATMSAVVPEGKRAFALRVNDVSGVAGFLVPGDRVDIILTRDPTDQGNGRQDRVSDIILQNIVVRGTDQIADTDRNKPQVVRTVTVEVTPEEAQKLALAMQVGQLSLALRNIASTEEERARTIRVPDLIEAKKAGPARARQEPTVRVRRGTHLTISPING
jgi:pilus assembly protein CpaB